MSKLAIFFPGQGSQFVGMGRELVQAFPRARAVYEQADEVLGLPLSRMILEGPEAELNATEIAQPALLTASVAAWQALLDQVDLPQERCLAAGHSLGEYSALVAAGSLPFAQALGLVRTRGLLMQTAARSSRGGMAAVIGLDPAEVEGLCRAANSGGGVQVANLNCPGQVVVSGSEEALGRLASLAAENKTRVIPLKVSGPFHSQFMRTAAEQLAPEVARVDFRDPAFPVWANVSARRLQNPEDIRRSLVAQVSGAVRWEESVRDMLSQQVQGAVEVGPGKVLRGLLKKIAPDVPSWGAFSPEEISTLAAELSRVLTGG